MPPKSVAYWAVEMGREAVAQRQQLAVIWIRTPPRQQPLIRI